jgi:tRNA(His) 5'-end guanylyltransferase
MLLPLHFNTPSFLILFRDGTKFHKLTTDMCNQKKKKKKTAQGSNNNASRIISKGKMSSVGLMAYATSEKCLDHKPKMLGSQAKMF